MGPWLTLAGGVALFSYGLTLTGDAIRKLTQGGLRHWLLLATRTTWGAGGLGVVATLLAGSSSAITVMVVGFVGAGLLTLPRALSVMLGAAIGTTLTVQLVSLDFTRFAPVLIFLGVVLALVQRWRRTESRGVEILLLGFGFIFYGMLVMTGTARPLALDPGVMHFFRVLASVPVLPFLLALAFTAVIQNSATTIALTMSFALHGVVGPVTGMEMVLGANVGSTAASVYNALMGGRAARRTAGAYVILKTGSALVALIFVRPITVLLLHIGSDPARLLADGHSLFNLANGVIFLPLTGVVARYMERRWPDVESAPVSPLSDDRWLGDPEQAVAETSAEVVRMAELIDRRMMAVLPRLLQGQPDHGQHDFERAEGEIDLLQHAVHTYLSRIPRDDLNEGEQAEIIRLMVLANHLEHISDTLVKTTETAEKLESRSFVWSQALWRRVDEHLALVQASYRDAVVALRDRDDERARAVVQNQPEIRRDGDAMRYFVLVRREPWDAVLLAPVLELLDDLQTLSDRIAALGRILLGIL